MATLKGGRPSDPVRQFFLKLDGSTTKCVICNQEVSNMIEHLKIQRKLCSKQATDSCVNTKVKRAFNNVDTDHDDEIGRTPPPAKVNIQP